MKRTLAIGLTMGMAVLGGQFGEKFAKDALIRADEILMMNEL